MTKAIDLGRSLQRTTELPFGHPDRNFNDTPTGTTLTTSTTSTSRGPWIPPEEEHQSTTGPGDQPLCGDETPYAVYTDEPDPGSLDARDCIELVVGGLQEPYTHTWVYCLHCQREITAHRRSGVAPDGPPAMPAPGEGPDGNEQQGIESAMPTLPRYNLCTALGFLLGI